MHGDQCIYWHRTVRTSQESTCVVDVLTVEDDLKKQVGDALPWRMMAVSGWLLGRHSGSTAYMPVTSLSIHASDITQHICHLRKPKYQHAWVLHPIQGEWKDKVCRSNLKALDHVCRWIIIIIIIHVIWGSIDKQCVKVTWAISPSIDCINVLTLCTADSR